MSIVATEWGTGQVFWSFLWFFLFFVWIWLLIIVFSDIFRSRDLSGWAKALWVIFVILVPYLGVFVYLIARGHKMGQHAAEDAAAADAATRQYIQQVTTTSPAEELEKLARLREQGVITEDEYQQLKSRALAS
jgi:phosphoglycerol transferase MdoB-like AlkP superfamily enzyme